MRWCLLDTLKEITMLNTRTPDGLSERLAEIERSLLPAPPLFAHPAWSASLLACMTRYHVPGVSIAVIANSQLEWAGGYGVCEVGRSELITPGTIFQACSVSKPVTAVAALRLVR